MMWFGWPGAQDIFDAVQMALDDYGAIHGFGAQQNQYDAGCDVQTGEDAANTVIANGQNAGVVGPFCSTSTEGALPVLEDVTMVMISHASTRPDLPAFGPTVFNRVTVMDPDFDDYWHAQISGLQSVIDWEADFASRYGHAPNDLARYAYDATLVLMTQIEAVGTVDLDGNLVVFRPSLAGAVRGTTGLPGVTGSISFDSDGNRIP
jgi:ABC-type branched-subunit amino acid transport system substrate-binding protein